MGPESKTPRHRMFGYGKRQWERSSAGLCGGSGIPRNDFWRLRALDVDGSGDLSLAELVAGQITAQQAGAHGELAREVQPKEKRRDPQNGGIPGKKTT